MHERSFLAPPAMPLNPTEVFELHVRFVAARGLRQVISVGTMDPYIVISGNLVGVRFLSLFTMARLIG